MHLKIKELKNYLKETVFIFVFFSISMLNAGAQNDTSKSDITQLDFADLMKVSIAANKEQMLEEAASIVSVVTKKDIDAFGCRDISDILRLVPGFEYGVDVVSLAGLGFRGIWVHEGKALIMLNGLMLNDFGYGNYNFIGTMPACVIERVEIIRGPGSAIYGGFAEVCVINIITTSSKEKNNISLIGNGGVLGKNGYAANSNLFVSGNQNDLKFNFNIGYSEKPLSDREYQDFFGSSYQMNNINSFRKFQHIITEVSYKGFSFNFSRTSMDYNGQDAFYTVSGSYLGRSQDIYNYTNNGLGLKYEVKLNSKFKIIPLMELYSGNNIASGYSALNASGMYDMISSQKQQKVKGQISALYDLGKAGELTVGVGYIRDMSNNSSPYGDPGLHSPLGDSVFSLFTESKFALLQYLVKIKNVGFILGNRYESTSFGEALAPRVGVTFLKNKFNSKLLFGSSYRIPTPWQAYSIGLNFDPNIKLRAELSNTTELEIGYKFNRHISASVNAYYIDIDNPIVYNGLTNSYNNYGDIHSIGIEAEIRTQYNKCNGFLNFSYNKPGNGTSDGFLTYDKQHFLALPVYKINLGSSYVHGKIVLGSTFTFLSKRYGESQNSAQGLTTHNENTSYDPILLTNMTITYKGWLKKIDVSLSAYNLFDQKYLLIQPYYGAHAPLPANDRQIMIGLRLNL